jgi:hypothetical protein
MRYRPDIFNRITSKLRDWHKPYVTINALSEALRENAVHVQDCINECLRRDEKQRQQKQKLKLGFQSNSLYNSYFSRIEKYEFKNKQRKQLHPYDYQYVISYHIPKYDSPEKKKDTLCPRCNKPIPGRHSRVSKGHDKDKCDMDMVKLIVEG